LCFQDHIPLVGRKKPPSIIQKQAQKFNWKRRNQKEGENIEFDLGFI
jgi:hypothetical protein